MIALYEGPAPDGALGCRIDTLCRCYRETGEALLYRSDGGAVICRFGESLLAAGGCDGRELAAFADALGTGRIEAQGDIGDIPGDWRARRFPLLYRDCEGDAKIPFLTSLKDCFETICRSDGGFAADTRYLHWLSDVTRRQNRGCAKAYYSDGAAAVVSSAGERTAYLSSVAVLPKLRGAGRASALLEAIASDKLLRGRRLFTAAQSEGLVGFYQKNGFCRLGESLMILTKGEF